MHKLPDLSASGGKPWQQVSYSITFLQSIFFGTYYHYMSSWALVLVVARWQPKVQLQTNAHAPITCCQSFNLFWHSLKAICYWVQIYNPMFLQESSPHTGHDWLSPSSFSRGCGGRLDACLRFGERGVLGVCLPWNVCCLWENSVWFIRRRCFPIFLMCIQRNLNDVYDAWNQE